MRISDWSSDVCSSDLAWRPVAGSDLVEWPVTTARLAGRTLAAGGGGFMRLLPYGFTRWAVARMNAEGHPAILYFHPWEIDPGQPRVAGAPLKSRFRHYSGLSAKAGQQTGRANVCTPVNTAYLAY